MHQLIKNRGKDKKNASLYEVFHLGDRVKRKYKDSNSHKREYLGIILAIDKSNVEIYWDKIDGEYNPNSMDIDFTKCSIEDIFKGNKYYGPIKKERYK